SSFASKIVVPLASFDAHAPPSPALRSLRRAVGVSKHAGTSSLVLRDARTRIRVCCALLGTRAPEDEDEQRLFHGSRCQTATQGREYLFQRHFVVKTTMQIVSGYILSWDVLERRSPYIVFASATSCSSALPQPSPKPIRSCALRPSSSLCMARA